MNTKEVVIVNLNDKPKYQRILAGEPQTCGVRSGRVFLEPGHDCGVHSTEAHEEILVFLSGTGEAYIGENARPVTIGEGKVCYIPPHTMHNIKNTADKSLVYIYCVAPVHNTELK